MLSPRRLGIVGALAVATLFVLVWTQVDLDGDSLSTISEFRLGTDSFQADSDRDTIDDGWETAHGLSPLNPDSDNDTLRDREELTNRTNPLSSDSDSDGLSDPAELRLSTDPRDSDSDNDTLGDALEVELGTSALRADTEGDGLPDAREVLDGSNPHHPDSDGDAIGDVDEPRVDCNGNQRLAVIDPDDDTDQRTDGKEMIDERCHPDFDRDDVIDGLEKNTACIRIPDCDGDGVIDGTEVKNSYDPLNSDTFGTGTNDAVALAFQQSNQPPSRDNDHDGIPDSWESTSGLIGWGSFKPVPGRPDMLVEFLRVQGPDSGRYSYLDFSAAYESVRNVFAAKGFNFQWVETRVALPTEQRPSLIPSSYAPYYENVLGQAGYSANPYVTTVVMNPQHDQSQVLHAGIAPMRGTLAAVDYGMHVEISFYYTYFEYVWDWVSWDYVRVPRTGTLTLSPDLESLVVGNRQDLIREWGFSYGGMDERGQLFLQSSDLSMYWKPYWFSSNPYVVAGSTTVSLFSTGASVDNSELARTILHELGHTLGLCHAHEADCYLKFAPRDQFRHDESTMSYNSNGLGYLDSEWGTVTTYLTCPPQEPLASVARRATITEIIEQKYGYALTQILNVDQRKCGQPRILSSDFSSDAQPLYRASTQRVIKDMELAATSKLFVMNWIAPGIAINSITGSVGYFTLAAALSGATGWTFHHVWKRRHHPREVPKDRREAPTPSLDESLVTCGLLMLDDLCVEAGSQASITDQAGPPVPEPAPSALQKPRLTGAEVEAIILRMCADDFLTASQIANQLDRKLRTVKANYLPGLVNSRKLVLKHPEKVNHPDQAYRSRTNEPSKGQ